MSSNNKVKRGVSLYSYQEEYHFGKMTLEDCIAVSSRMGIEGIEIIGDQMVHGSPFPSEDFYGKWHGWMEKYNVKPVCDDIFINTSLYRNRKLTRKEGIKELENHIVFASRLGCKVVRLVSQTPPDIIVPCLPCAEKYDVAMALEIHAGMSFNDPYTQGFIEIMLKENSPYIGLVPDMGIFCEKFPRLAAQHFIRMGANKRIVDYIVAVYDSGENVGLDSPKIKEFVEKFTLSGIDRQFIAMSCGYEHNDINVLKEYMPYVKNVHAKFYEMTDEGVEYSIPYDKIIDFFKKEGYDGYLCSEYEGNRLIHDFMEVDSVEQVRRHQEMMKKYIEM